MCAVAQQAGGKTAALTARGDHMSRCAQRGFTYLLLMGWVAASGFMLMALSQNWVLDARRQREAELVFRGEQIRHAIESYQRATVEGQSPWPLTLADLLEDKRGPVVRHHLRRLWPDPVTGSGVWGLVKQGNGIKGVFSQSPQAPVAPPEGVRQYASWRFEAGTSVVTP